MWHHCLSASVAARILYGLPSVLHSRMRTLPVSRKRIKIHWCTEDYAFKYIFVPLYGRKHYRIVHIK